MISFSDDTKQVILISMIFNIFTTVLTVMVPLKIFQIPHTHNFETAAGPGKVEFGLGGGN